MDYSPRSQSVLHIHSPSSLQSRASRILAKVTNFKGRLRFNNSPSTISRRSSADKDDSIPSTVSNNPYHHHHSSVDGTASFNLKPYMSHPMLGNLLVEPFVPDDDNLSNEQPLTTTHLRRPSLPLSAAAPPIPAPPRAAAVTESIPKSAQVPSGASNNHKWAGLPLPNSIPQTTPATIDGLSNGPSSGVTNYATSRNPAAATSPSKQQHRSTPSIPLVSAHTDSPTPARVPAQHPSHPLAPPSTTTTSPSSHDTAHPRLTLITSKNNTPHHPKPTKPRIDTTSVSSPFSSGANNNNNNNNVANTKSKTKSFSPARLFARKASRSRLKDRDRDRDRDVIDISASSVPAGRDVDDYDDDDDQQPPTPHPKATMGPLRPPTPPTPLPPLPHHNHHMHSSPSPVASKTTTSKNKSGRMDSSYFNIPFSSTSTSASGPISGSDYPPTINIVSPSPVMSPTPTFRSNNGLASPATLSSIPAPSIPPSSAPETSGTSVGNGNSAYTKSATANSYADHPPQLTLSHHRHHHQQSPFGSPQQQPSPTVATRRNNQNRFSLTIAMEDGTPALARLSPSFIARPPPLPILNLPTLPPVSPVVEVSPRSLASSSGAASSSLSGAGGSVSRPSPGGAASSSPSGSGVGVGVGSSTGMGGRASPSAARRLREMPSLPHHGSGRYTDAEGEGEVDEEEEDSLMDDPDAAAAIVAGLLRPSTSGSAFSTSTTGSGLSSTSSASTLTVDGIGRHSRSSSYASSEDHLVEVSTSERGSGQQRRQRESSPQGRSFLGAASLTSDSAKPELGMELPGVDTSRIDLGAFLDVEGGDDSEVVGKSKGKGRSRVVGKEKGKGKARQREEMPKESTTASEEEEEDDDDDDGEEENEEDEEVGKTPTSRAPYGDYFSSRTFKGAGAGVATASALPTRKDSLKLRTGGNVAGLGIGGGGMRTPRPDDHRRMPPFSHANNHNNSGRRRVSAFPVVPPPLQASFSWNGNGVDDVITPGGDSNGNAINNATTTMTYPTRPGMYKHASRSLIDIRTVEKRESIKMVLRAEEKAAEEEERRRRRRSRRVFSAVGGATVGGEYASMLAQLVTDERRSIVVDEDGDGEEKGVDGKSDKREGGGDVDDSGADAGVTATSTTATSTTGATAAVMGADVDVNNAVNGTAAFNPSNRWSKAPAYENIVFDMDDVGISPALRRRRSLPTFGAATADPPPYPEFIFPSSASSSSALRLMHIQPRDDEGRERLPSYSNDIYLCAELPRKMEFTSAGVQAKDRKWRRVVCVIEGTALKIYKCPRGSGIGKKSVLGEWWERKVGVGDVAVPVPSSSLSSSGNAAAAASATSAAANAGGDILSSPSGGAGGQGKRNIKLSVDVGLADDADDQVEIEVLRPATPLTPITPVRTQPHLSGEHPYIPGQPPPIRTPLLPASPSQNQVHIPASPPAASRSRLNLAVNLFKSHSRTNSDASSSLSVHQHQQQHQSSSPRPSLNIPSAGLNGGSGFPMPDSGSYSSVNLSMRVPSPAFSSSGSRPGTSTSFYQQQQQPSEIHTQGGSVLFSSSLVPEPGSADLIRRYTMQNAESGLGNDYIKRKNVIRVRAEGEQFLLQAKDVSDVVAWIEALQASANIALDLDERLMPKGPLFPRRRRRRRAAAASSTDGATQPPT